MARFTKEDLQAVIGAASKDSTRFNINTIHIDGGKLVATNGHYLQSVDTGDAPGVKPFTLGLVDATKLVKAMGKGQSVDITNPITARIECAIEGGGTFEFEAMPIEYPAYAKIIPSGDVVRASILVNAKYLKAICDAAIKSGRGDSRDAIIKIDIREPLAPIHIKTNGVEKGGFEAVVMPVRDSKKK